MASSTPNYIDPTIIRKFTNPNSITLTYIDLIVDASKIYDLNYEYVKEIKDEYGNIVNEISEEQKKINQLIESKKSFDVIFYSKIYEKNADNLGVFVPSIPYKTNNRHIKIGNLYLNTPFKSPRPVKYGVKDPESTVNADELVTGIDNDLIIENNDSILYTGMSSLDIEIDNLFLVKDQSNTYLTDITDNGEYYKTSSISNGDCFFLLIDVETLDENENKYVQLSYKFIYEENKSLDDDPINPDTPTPDRIDSSVPFNDSTTGSITKIDYALKSISDESCARYAFINACSLETLCNLPNKKLVTSDPMYRIHISPLCPTAFTFVLTITRHYDNSEKTSTSYQEFSYDPATNQTSIETPTFDRCVNMNRPDVSYALLRTNPKLTGNIKVVIDSKSNIFLDTFKISNVLSDKKYRHINVGYNSYYGNTLMKYFKDVPSSELYRIEDRCYDIFTTYKTLDKQYYDVYNYGVKTNDDKLYSENFSLLAPLCVKRIMPDFFLIFRVDKNVDSYDEETMSDKEKINFFIKNGVIVKSYDMRQNSKLGTYVRNIYEHSKSHIGDIFVSYENDNYNKFIGISLDRGEVSQFYESVYDEKCIHNQVQMNEFYSSGFERNHIVSKNIINFEFMFNDETQDLFSINTYFGIYVKVNEEDNSFSCIGCDTSGNYVYDIDKIHTFPINTKLSNTNLSDLIYGLTTPDKFIRLNGSLYDSSISSVIDEFKLKPHKSLFNTSLNVIKNNSFKGYIHLSFSSLFKIGEHYRIIDKTTNTIYEVIISALNENNKGLYLDDYNLSEILTNYYTYLNTKYTIKRIGLYVQHPQDILDSIESISGKDNSIYAPMLKTFSVYLNEEVESLFYAFRKFGVSDRFISYKLLNNVMSLCSYDANMIFEKICSKAGFTNEDNNYILNSDEEQYDLTFFGAINPNKTVLYVYDPDWKSRRYSYLYPVDFEVLGNRMAYVCGFLDLSKIEDTNKIYELLVSDETILDKTLLYINSNNENEILDGINLNLFVNKNENYEIHLDNSTKFKNIKSFNNLNFNILNIKSPLTKNNMFSLYSAYPLNAGICSIFQFKDFNFDILDSRENLLYDNSPVGSSGEFVTEHTFFNDVPPESDDKDDVSELDDDSSNNINFNTIIYEDSSNFRNLNLSITAKSEENLYDYIDYTYYKTNNYDVKISNVLKSKYNSTDRLSFSPFLSQYICKWKSVGTDARIKNMRIMYDSSINTNSYFVVNDRDNVNTQKYSYDTYLGILCDKNGNTEYNKYTKNLLDDAVIEKSKYVKNSILYDNLNVDDILNSKDSFDNKLSLVYSNGKNSLEFISGGIKFRLTSSNEHIIDLSKYIGYVVSFINMPYNTLSNNSSELIIDEISKEITLIWYSNCSSLLYGIKYHPSHNKIKNSYNNFNNLIETRLNYKKSLSDVKISRISNVTNNSTHAILDYDKNTSLKDTSEYLAYVVMSNINIDTSTNYTKEIPVVLTGKLETNEKYFEDTYSDKLCLSNPFIWQNNGNTSESINNQATNVLLDYYTSNITDSLETLLYTNNLNKLDSNIRKLSDLKSDLEDCAVYIKTSNGLYNYSSINIISVEYVNPLNYNVENRPGVRNRNADVNKQINVHSTYAEPMLKDVFEFNYNISSEDAKNVISVSTLNKTFEKSFNCANISINTIKTMAQQWLNKITDENNYCFKNINTQDFSNNDSSLSDFKFAYDVKHNVSLINDMWYNSVFRKYSLQENSKNQNNEIYSKIKGYTTGYEIKSFFNSKGVLIKNDINATKTLEITLWKDTLISNTNNYIRLNISNSLLYVILYSDGFNKSWNKLKLKSNDFKMNYIKNYILKFINIDNKCKFELRKVNTILKSYYFNSEFDDQNTELCTNYKNELKYENEKYYMYIYPEDKCSYYAKMIINI